MDKTDKIKFKYIFQDDYNPKYVNGAFGGISPQGEIVLNFYLERVALPRSQTYSVKEGLALSEISEQREPGDHESSVVRFVENGIVLDLAHAEDIHRWQGAHIETLKSSLKKHG
jgi:hypothetical protein